MKKSSSNQPVQIAGRLPFPQRGEIWWIRTIPNQPKDPHWPRPAIIISTDARNRYWDSVMIIPLSHGISNINRNFHVFVPAGTGGLPKDSYARCELASTIEKDFLDDAKGSLGIPIADKYLFAILRGVRKAIGDQNFD